MTAVKSAGGKVIYILMPTQYNTIRDNITPHNLTNIDINKKDYYHSKKNVLWYYHDFGYILLFEKKPILHTQIQIISLYFTILLFL